MKFYACSLANEGKGNLVPLLTGDPGLLEKFIADHDRPGRGVYACPNPLRDDATRRCKESVAAIVTLHVDVDFKRLVETPQAVEDRIRALPFPFEIRRSGGGLHVLANLKEPCENGGDHYRRAEDLRTQLVTLLAGDPAPNHSAALLRVVGSHNTKYGEPREVEVIQSGDPVDLTEVEELLNSYTLPLFETKPECQHSGTSNVVPLDAYVPIDTDAFLADPPTTGEAINATAHRVMRALIVRDGMSPEASLDAVVDAIMTMAADHFPD